MLRRFSSPLFLAALVTAVASAACNSNSAGTPPKPAESVPEPQKVQPEPVPPPVPAKVEPVPANDGLLHSGPVSFVVNGQAAEVAPRPNDDSEPLGTWTRMNNYLSLEFYGDAKGAAKRSWLRVKLDNFEGKAGEYKVRVGFSRYREANGAGETIYHTSENAPGVLNIEVLSETEPSPLGKTWKASGKFRADLPLKPGESSDTPTIAITDGSFTDLVIQEIGRPK